ncbi:hypothetical protein EPI10_028118 [Gossypium australe]|uniref:Uncharacterized protein n=1 Tax=Gossypium australe TaxID=47621 RepID=A0A5B6UX01_9ROSI|nr:hypothetical protein EPI10_028118 [Gossypium australe]
MLTELKAKSVFLQQIRKAQKIDFDLIGKLPDSEFHIGIDDSLILKSNRRSYRKLKSVITQFTLVVLVANYEASDLSICIKMFNLLASTLGIATAYFDYGMEMGTSYHGFRVRVIAILEEERCYLTLDTKLHFSTVFHPQADDQSVRVTGKNLFRWLSLLIITITR